MTIEGLILIPHEWCGKSMFAGHKSLGGGLPTAVKLPNGQWFGSYDVLRGQAMDKWHGDSVFDMDDLVTGLPLMWEGLIVPECWDMAFRIRDRTSAGCMLRGLFDHRKIEIAVMAVVEFSDPARGRTIGKMIRLDAGRMEIDG